VPAGLSAVSKDWKSSHREVSNHWKIPEFLRDRFAISDAVPKLIMILQCGPG
jgi:hypothetical protein